MSFKIKNRVAVISIDDDIYDGAWWGISYRDIKDSLSENDGEFDSVHVRINSAGGSVTEGMAIRNEFLRLKEDGFDVSIEVDGVAASIASVIALSGTSLKMRNGSYLMIHRPYTMASGDHEDLRNIADTIETMYDDVVGVYQENSNLDRSSIEEYMKKETWFNSKKAVEHGFAEQVIIDETEVVLNYAGSKECRSMVMNRYKNIPLHILNNEKITNSSETALLEPQGKGEEKMALNDYLAKNPDDKKEFDAAILAAKTSASEGAKSANAKVVARVKGVIASDKYNKQVRAYAVEVLAGEKSVDGFDAFVAMVDMQAEEKASKDAETETDLTEETAPESQDSDTPLVENKGVINASNFKEHLEAK